ncbi:M12 family metallo-peptidase [Altibacter sp. HG106]|uniref:M12 family metallo-peptidase n=1 Tax=Altibacter sp. HG106 TaxID=3023937 RepID=UPI00235007FA|nr:M12 family metallo-peptidase [Altibacter sp. HG106]MDC7995099.1 M12 family metallo-peptidase [Altibacter sp. HG106]
MKRNLLLLELAAARLHHFGVNRLLLSNLQKTGVMLCLLLLSTFTFGQSQIYQKVQQQKSNGVSFQETSVFSETTTRYQNGDTFYDLSAVHLLQLDAPLESIPSEALSFQIPLGKQSSVTIDLISVPERFFNYELVTSDGENLPPNQSGAKHFQGVVRGQPNSLVAISFFDNDVMGLIATSEGNFNLGKLTDSNQFIVYNDTNLRETPTLDCTTEDDFEPYDQEILFREAPKQTRAFETNCVRFYFETEFDIFQSFGSVTGVENYVTALYNQVAILYMNEGIDTSISMINVWTSTDPYTSTGTAGLLSQFQANTGAFTGDLGQLLTFRNVGGGRAAGFDGICNPNSDLSLSVSGNLTSTVTNVPTYSWNVMVVTHEFGHLFGSRHTHACVWNGNNTAIDGCAGFTEGSCSLPGIPSTGGTIMSYCHIQTVGINFTNGFGQQPGNVIRAEVANGGCLGSCSPCPVTSNPFDLYTKDRPFDVGNEPNPDTGPMWISEDIWVRQSLDGGTTPQNPEFKLLEPNGVYVTVRNRGTTTSDCAVLKVYFSKASTGLQWPTHFNNYYQNVGGSSVLHGDIIGTAIVPSLAPGASTLVEIPWYPPNPADFTNDVHHFCLVSRILSDNDPMNSEVAGSVSPNVRNNNNIAWKNLSVYDVDPVNLPPPTSVFVRGIDRESERVRIRFYGRGFEDYIPGPYFENGDVLVTIEPELFERMLQAGSLENDGVKIVDDNVVQLYSPEAVFTNVPVRYNETFSLGFQFRLDEGVTLKEGEGFLLDVVQEDQYGRVMQGGERFFITDEKERSAISDVNSFDFSIVPNPNNGSFEILTEKVTTGSYEVLDIYGVTIARGSFNATRNVSIDLNTSPSGVYFVKVSANGSIATQMMVKQ